MKSPIFYPLTLPQKGIWYTEKFYPNTGITNVLGTMSRKGHLDYDLLSRAINLTIKYNDGLRLRIFEDSKGPHQYVTDHQDIDFELLDFSNQNGWESLREWIDHEKRIPLSLGDSAPYKVTLFKISEDEGGIFFKGHHCIIDAWSVTLIANQVNEYYSQLLKGTEPAPIVCPSYIDYIESELLYLQSDKFVKSKEFWNNKFSTVPELTTLKTRKQRFDSCAAERKTFFLSKELTSQINQYAEEKGISVFILFAVTLAIYLHKVLGRDDIIIGTPLLNRPSIKEKMTIGMFIETLPVLIKVNSDMDFETLISQVAQEWRELRSHRYPYPLLLEDIRSKQKLFTNLYDIMLDYQNAKFDKFEFQMEPFFSGSEACSICFHISDRENTGQLRVDIDYQIDLFTEQEIVSLYKHLISICQQGMNSPTLKITDLQLLDPQEKEFLIYEVNRTEVEFPDNCTVQDLIEKQATLAPDKTAVVCGDTSLTFTEINKWSNQLARLLRQQGVGPGNIVALMTNRSIEMMVGLVAILKAGAAYLPLDPNYPLERVQFMLNDSGASLLLTNISVDTGLYNIPCIDLRNTSSLPNDDSNLDNLNNPSDLAYVIYTSGSTGKPKGVMIEHRSVCNFFTAMNCCLNLHEKTILSVTTMSFDIFVFESLLPLALGLTIAIAQEEEQINPFALKKFILANQVNILQTTPSRMALMMLDDEFMVGLDSLTDIILAGEPFPEELLSRLKSCTSARIFNGYGPTETTIYATFADLTDKQDISIGTPIANTQVYILDKFLNPVPKGTPGELYISGTGVARGYLNRPDLTAEKFIPNPFIPNSVMYRTGDIAKWGLDDCIYFIGRSDFQVKLRGYRIELGEIEKTLQTHEKISEAVVLLQSNDGLDHLVAYCVADPDLEASSIREYLARYLPEYMIPSYYVFLSEIPLDPNGKTNRKALQELAVELGPSHYGYQPCRNEVDELLVHAWSEVLQVEQIGIDDNFFDLGGDSLKIIRILISVLIYNWDLTARDFYRYQTIRQLSDKIRGISEDDLWEANTNKEISVVPVQQSYDDIQISGTRKDFGNILLTGATGYLGAHLLKELLDRTESDIYCLVRGNSNNDAQARLYRVLDFYFPLLTESANKRIHVLCGDITEDNWGLPPEQYYYLAQQINTVFHCAAKVRHYGGYTEFEKVNVEGTRTITNFCLDHQKTLHYISTTSISGRYLVKQNLGDVTLTENDFYIGQHYYENVYVRSKFEAENLILNAMHKGLNGVIYRMGILTGRYTDGRFQANIHDNALYNRIKSIIQIGMIPEEFLSQELEFSPVDYCSRAIVLLAELPESNKHIYHIYNHKTLPVKKFIVAAGNCGYKIEYCSSSEFEQYIRDILSDPKRSADLTGIINDLNLNKTIGLQDSPNIDSSITTRYLSLLDFEWPEITFEYISKLLAHMKSVGFVEDPGQISMFSNW